MPQYPHPQPHPHPRPHPHSNHRVVNERHASSPSGPVENGGAPLQYGHRRKDSPVRPAARSGPQWTSTPRGSRIARQADQGALGRFARTHASTYTDHTRARTHTCTHAHTLTHTDTHTHSLSLSLTHTHTHNTHHTHHTQSQYLVRA
jgi:hypothetical protein